MSVPEQVVVFNVAQPLPAVVPTAGQMHAPPTQVLEPWQPVVLTTTLQAGVLLSWPQVATVELFRQYEVVALHDGSLSQAQAALGSDPWQLSSVGHTWGDEPVKQFCASFVQVTTSPEPLQKVPAAVQPAGPAGQVQTPVAVTQVVVPWQATGLPHWLQPPVPATQVSEPPLAQRCEPSTQVVPQVTLLSGCASVDASSWCASVGSAAS
jgi:hypothetical protein